MISTIFVPTWVRLSGEADVLAQMDTYELITYNETGEPSTTNVIYLTVLSVLSALLGLASIFSYKNRMTQVKLNMVNILLIGAVIIINAYFFATYQTLGGEAGKSQFSFGFFLPFVALLMNNMANRFIKRDEQLVKSVDRLR
ncbi:hypothetical protein GCM10023331_01260 [Algivirga pacifica]|uniref:Transcription termination factor Rho n=2 Tax=Algivirga pacifica TaxID=1162670 RepID=A0ABP9D2U6_9BACT